MADQTVAHVVVEMLVGVADRAGLPLAELCAGLPIEEDTLRRRLGGLEWSLFAELMDRLEARLGHEAFLAQCATVKEVSPISQRLLGSFLSPRRLLKAVGVLFGPSMYPMYTTRFVEREEAGALVAHLTLRLQDGLRGSRSVFDAHAAAMSGLPAFIGQPPFPTRSVTTDRGGDYWFTVRPAPP